MRNVISLVLGGGRGTRLSPLTKFRSKPAVPLAGKYRLIDIPLSNCINSGLNHIYVLTQFLSVSLHRHLRQAYQFDQFSGGYVGVLAAQQTEGDSTSDWYQGTADAVRKNLRYLEQPGVDYVVILSGDQLYRMNFQDMLDTHKKSGAEVTIAGIPVTREEAKSLGLMRIDTDGRVQGFLEKPKTDEEIDTVKMDPAWLDAQGLQSKGRDCLASMGIYVFNRDFLVEVLRATEHQDFGKEVFPTAFRTKHVQVHLFDGYWEDIGTIKAFYEANLSLAKEDPPFQLGTAEAPIFSRARYLPPSRFDGVTVSQSLIADGCTIGKGTVIENSVIGLRCDIGENCVIRDSILMGADYSETDDEWKASESRGVPPLGIGASTEIIGAIVDKNCRIGDNVKIHNASGVTDRVDDLCTIRDGIPVVQKEAIISNGWTLE